MGSELTVQGGAEVEQRPAPTFMDVIAAAARDPQVDMVKMQQLLEMKERIDRQAAETEYNAAMMRAQSEIPAIFRDSENGHTKTRFATLETINEHIRPIYTKHGFSLSFDAPPSAIPGEVTVACTTFHSAGHSKQYSLSGSLDGIGSQGKSNKTNIQALGSTVTYLRRYLTCMIFNVVLTNEDRDGNDTRAGAMISQEQADNLDRFITEIGMDPASLSNFLRIMEAKSVREIKADRYRQAMILLQAKREKSK